MCKCVSLCDSGLDCGGECVVWMCVQVVQREMETQAALEEAEVKALELERQRVQLQHQLARYQQEVWRNT